MRLPPKVPAAIAALALLALTAGCGGSPRIEPAPRLPSVVGSISLEGGSSVPTSAVLVVRLLDLSHGDSHRVVVEQVISNPGSFPYRFRLFYRQSSIDFGSDYGIEARILSNGRPAWTHAPPTPVLTKGRPQVVEIVLKSVQ